MRRLVAILAAGLAASRSLADEFPVVDSKKGLQVQMTEDAISLGIRHAALNLRLDALLDAKPQPDSLAWKGQGGGLHFRRAAVETFDRQVRPLSEAGVIVYAILLAGPGPLGHPKADAHPPNGLVAFDTVTPDGAARFRACMEFIADRYSKPPYPNGRVAGFIVGNEVNSHWWWYNMGPASMEEVAAGYERAVRIVHEAVREVSPSARVYLSLEHHWAVSYHRDAQKACAGRALLDSFAANARRNGDFDWHLAFHPYPENLLEPRSWLDRTALPNPDSPRITFKNLQVLRDYLRRPELLWNGRARSIILSEQGFHAAGGEAGELNQAAGFVHAWKQVEALDGIDAFILHRHVDHAEEGGLNLGLWTRKPGSIAAPGRRRRMYDVFRAAGTPDQAAAFSFAQPLMDAETRP